MRALVVNHSNGHPLTARLREALRGRVDPQGPVLACYKEVENRLAQVQADMVIVVLGEDPEGGLEALRKLRRQASGCLLAVGQTSEPKLILRAQHAGADLYLDEAELETGLEAAMARLESKGHPPEPAGRMLAVLASSGVSGASTLAVNVAAVLAKDHKTCALLDLKPGRGDLAALLDLRPTFTLADLCLNAARLDRAMFEKLLLPHPSGIHLLASPQAFDGLRAIAAQGVSQGLFLARKLFPHVVVDLEDCFHEEQVLTVRQASVILLVVRLDFTSLRNARRILAHLNELEVPEGRIRLVANRHGQPGELTAPEAEEALRNKIAYFIPDDPKTINRANNAGVPAVLHAPSARVSHGIAQMARSAVERRKSDSLSDVRVFAQS